jgi:outer membrane protein TolC
MHWIATVLALSSGTESLHRSAFVTMVLEQNPGLRATQHAAAAAELRIGAASVWPDPELRASAAPLSIGSPHLGVDVAIGQHIPWPQKRARAEEVARAHSASEKEQHENARLNLALAASHLFDRVWATRRAAELTEEHLALARAIHGAVLVRFEIGTASRQATYQAEIEIAQANLRLIRLLAEERVVWAQMNTLAGRSADAPWPAARYDDVDLDVPLPDATTRPDVRALQFQHQSSVAARELAAMATLPELSLHGSYAAASPLPEHRLMAGIALTVPAPWGAKTDTAQAAQEESMRLGAALQDVQNEATARVVALGERARAAALVVRLYREQLVPLAHAQIDAAQIGYESGRTGLQDLLDAERTLRDVEMQSVEAHAAWSMQRADLLAAMGHMPVNGVSP